MIRYESAVTVDRPPETVFSFLIEPELQGRWADLTMRPLTEGPPRTGSQMEITFGRGPIKARIGLEYSSLEPGRRLAFRTFWGPVDWQGEYRLAPSGSGGTDLSQQGTMRFTGLWRLIEPLVGGEISRGEVKELEKLKAAAEAVPA